jgi:hypothetical protein
MLIYDAVLTEAPMNAEAAPPVAPDGIFQLASGFMSAKLFFTAGEIGLFEALGEGPRTADELAGRTGAPRRTLEVVANAMVAVGMLTLADGRYANSPVAQTYLTGRTPADMRPLLTFWNRLSYPSWNALGDAVRRDGKKDKTFDFAPEDQAIFSAGVEAASIGGAMALADVYDFRSHKQLVDIGGGTGSFLKVIRRRHPHLTLTLFELPKTAAYARSRFTDEERAHIAIVEGDMLTGPLPGGVDALLLAHVLHVFDIDQDRDLLSRIRASAPAHARLLIVDFFLDPTRTAPVMASLMSGEFLVHTTGRSYSAAEVSEWLRETGWTVLGPQPLAGPVSLLVAENP